MAEEKQVLVRFVTKLPPELHVPQTQVVGLAAAAGLRLLLLLLLVVAKAEWVPWMLAGRPSLFEALWPVPNHQPLAGSG